MKKNPMKWEKIFANNVTGKAFITKLYRQLTQLSNKNTTQFKKWAEDLNKHFSKEDIQMLKRHMKRYSTLLIIRETQIKTTMSCHLITVRVTITQKSSNNKCWRKWGKNGTLLHCWWEHKSV